MKKVLLLMLSFALVIRLIPALVLDRHNPLFSGFCVRFYLGLDHSAEESSCRYPRGLKLRAYQIVAVEAHDGHGQTGKADFFVSFLICSSFR